MNGLQKAAGIASLIQSLGFVVVLFFLLVLLPGVGIGPNDLNNPAKVLPAIGSPLVSLFYALFVVFGLTVVVTLGVYDRLEGNPRGLTRIAVAAAITSGTLWITFGMVGSSMVSTFGPLYQQSPAAAAAAFPAANAVLNGFLNAAPFAGGWNILLWGLAVVVRTGRLPKRLGYLVVVAGVVRLATYVVPLALLNPIQLLLSVIWGAWLGFELLKGSAKSATVNAHVLAQV